MTRMMLVAALSAAVFLPWGSDARFLSQETVENMAAAASDADASLEEAVAANAGECAAGDDTCGAAATLQEPSANKQQGGEREPTANVAQKRQLQGSDCYDKDPYCADMMKRPSDACIVRFEFARDNCRKTCQLCGVNTESSAHNLYSETPQQVLGTSAPATWEHSAKVDEYMYEKVYVQDEFATVRTDCKNRHASCTFWASVGECEKNPTYMQMQCAPACFSCDKLSFENRCPFDENEPTVWTNPGDLDHMFTRIVTDEQFQQYNPQILSRPLSTDDNVLDGPWVVVLDDFLSADECSTLQDLGGVRGYARSRDVGARKFDGSYDGKESTGRTSTNAWCTEECWDHNVTQAVHERMQHLIEIPTGNYEYFQLLRYEVGQFYEQHHDYIAHHVQRKPGPRILTIFLYLNDVEQGGGTNFPLLNNMTVYPKQGRALLWPSVLDEAPMTKDFRTEHQALPVEKGIKFGANVWVHQRDFKEAWKKGCH